MLCRFEHRNGFITSRPGCVAYYDLFKVCGYIVFPHFMYKESDLLFAFLSDYKIQKGPFLNKITCSYMSTPFL